MMVVDDAYHTWGPGYSNYDGPETSAGRGYNYRIAQKNFPVDAYPKSQEGAKEEDKDIIRLTSEMVDAVYEAWFPDHTKFFGSESDLSYNCHGFVTKTYTWIETSWTGIDKVVVDDYEPGTPPNNAYAFAKKQGSLGPRPHSYQIVYQQIYFWGIPIWIQAAVVEKFNVSPVMVNQYTTGVTAYSYDIRKEK